MNFKLKICHRFEIQLLFIRLLSNNMQYLKNFKSNLNCLILDI